MNKLKFYLLSLSIVFFGCSSDSKSDQSSSSGQCIEIDIDKIKTDGVVYYSSVFDGFEIIPLETLKESLIGEISSIRFCGDYIIILD